MSPDTAPVLVVEADDYLDVRHPSYAPYECAGYIRAAGGQVYVRLYCIEPAMSLLARFRGRYDDAVKALASGRDHTAAELPPAWVATEVVR